jgi:hypothetical protein
VELASSKTAKIYGEDLFITVTGQGYRPKQTFWSRAVNSWENRQDQPSTLKATFRLANASGQQQQFKDVSPAQTVYFSSSKTVAVTFLGEFDGHYRFETHPVPHIYMGNVPIQIGSSILTKGTDITLSVRSIHGISPQSDDLDTNIAYPALSVTYIASRPNGARMECTSSVGDTVLFDDRFELETMNVEPFQAQFLIRDALRPESGSRNYAVCQQ